jgi:hypothetical protein
MEGSREHGSKSSDCINEGFSLPAERLLASQEGLRSVDLVICFCPKLQPVEIPANLTFFRYNVNV